MAGTEKWKSVLEFKDTLIPSGFTQTSASQARIDLRFKRTGLVGIISPDAASRDQLMRAICGEITPHEGRIEWNGETLSNVSSTSPRLCAKVSLASANNPATVGELIAARLHELSHATQLHEATTVDSLLKECDLQASKNQPSESLPLQQKARVAIALALASSPAIVLCSGIEGHPELCDDAELAAMLALIAIKGRLVFTTGIAMKTLHFFESIVVMRDGFLAFHSAPQHLLHYFGIPDLFELDARLSKDEAVSWHHSWAKHRVHFYKLLHGDDESLPKAATDFIPQNHKSEYALKNALPESDGERARFLLVAFNSLRREMAKLIVGQEEVIEQLLIAILAGGHCLLEGVPGLAKTAIVRSLSRAMQLSFRRIQFTPDLMPADITGTDIIQEDPISGTRKFVFQKGPIFTQMLLADEINRTPAKTQAALLEAMQEHSVTASGHTLHLDQPFFVLATQNPIEQEGTYPLPEAQKDRFLFHIHVGYPERDQERLVIERTTGEYQADIQPVIDGRQILECQKTARKVPVPDHVMNFVLDLVRNTRPDSDQAPKFTKELISWGAGPRACQCLVLAGKVRALLKGRFHVSLEDIEVLAKPVLRHRIVPTFNAESEGITQDAIIEKLLAATPRTHSQSPL